MTHDDILAKWQAEAAALDHRNALVPGGALCREFLADLEAVIQSEAEEVLTVDQAAVESGYSKEHIARMVRQGTVPNAGRKQAPRIRRADLPRKPGRLLAPSQRVSYDPTTDARDLLCRQRRTR